MNICANAARKMLMKVVLTFAEFIHIVWRRYSTFDSRQSTTHLQMSPLILIELIIFFTINKEVDKNADNRRKVMRTV